jgi:hypothetical protein
MALKNYFRNFEDVLTGQDEKDPWPTKEDLKQEILYLDQKSRLDVQSLLDEHRYCLVEGAERRGKTTLVRFVGLWYLEDWHVYQVDVSRVLDTSDLDDFVQLLRGGFLDRSDTLIVIEDCHLKPEITEKLLDEAENCTQASFLFTLRTVKQRQGMLIEDPFEDSVIRENDLVVYLDNNEETIYNNIKGIVDKFVENNRNELIRVSKPALTPEDYQYMVAQTDGNKRILKYYLDAWLDAKDPHLSLRRVDRNLILEQFHKERLKALTEVQLEVVLIMSALGQFEVPILIRPLFPSHVSKLDFDRAADELNTLRGLAFRLPRGAWLLADTESKLTIECYQKTIDNRFVYEILKTYVKEAANYFEVFHALCRAQEQPILVSLVEDTEVHSSLIRRFRYPETTLVEMLYVLHSITWADRTKSLDLWHEYKKQAGERFFDEVQRKLSEQHDIRISASLLAFLRYIDREGEAVPFADALAVEPLISQIQAEAVDFSNVRTFLSRLHTLAPKKVNQVMNNLSESDYKRLGEKARDKNSQQIMWFFHLLAIHTVSEAKSEAFIEGIGIDFLSRMVMSSPISVTVKILQLIKACTPRTVKQVLKGLNDINYRKLGEEAGKGKNLQQVYWFIRLLASDEQLKRFADPFLQSIGLDDVNRMASESTASIIHSLRKKLNRINTDTAKKMRENLTVALSEEEWIEKWSSESIGSLSWRLWGWTRSLNPQLRERGRKLVKRLTNADIALQCGKADAAEPVEKLGWLLFCAHYLDEEAAKGLALKVLQVFNAVSMAYSLDHLVHLLRNSRWCNPDVAQQLVEKIFSIDATSLLSKGDLNWFCQLLWEATLSNESKTKDWVTDVRGTFWEDLAVNAPSSNVFHLLLALWQANEELGRRVTHAVAQRLLASPKLMDDSQSMPLLGLLASCDLKPHAALSFSPTEKVTELCIYPTSQRLAFSLLYLQESKREVIPSFIKACLITGVTAIGITLLLAEYPLPWTASTIEKILVSAKSESQIQREDVYDRMILLFKTIQSRQIYLNALLDKMCAPQFAPQHELTTESEGSIEQNEQRTRSWATIRLMNAIDKGIFIVQETEHPITHKASRVLSLDWGHPQVAFAFDITRNLLLGLRDAQRDKGWADYGTWKTAFEGSWKEEPLPPQQLRYWQGILLKTNVVKVDYQEMDESRWVIAFQVNSKHLLAKSLIMKS